MSFPLLSKSSCGSTSIITYKSPGEPPCPASPSPAILNLEPESTPAGIVIDILLVFCTLPAPLHSSHFLLIDFPTPLQTVQVEVVVKNPNGVLWLLFSVPVPEQFWQITTSSGLFAPIPLQSSQVSSLGILISFFTPLAASSKVMSSSYLKSCPLVGLCLLLPVLPPKNVLNKSSKSNSAPPKSNPCAPPPKPSEVVPYLSYCDLFFSSPRTEAASLISLNLSFEPASLFKSG